MSVPESSRVRICPPLLQVPVFVRRGVHGRGLQPQDVPLWLDMVRPTHRHRDGAHAVRGVLQQGHLRSGERQVQVPAHVRGRGVRAKYGPQSNAYFVWLGVRLLVLMFFRSFHSAC